MKAGLENGPDTVFYVDEEVVQQALNAGLPMRLWKRTETGSEKPNMKVRYGKP